MASLKHLKQVELTQIQMTEDLQKQLKSAEIRIEFEQAEFQKQLKVYKAEIDMLN